MGQTDSSLIDTKISPMMQQWHACKKAAPHALLFFRLGDFYEAFYEDAIQIAKELELTLTKRQEIPMCGVPHHTSEAYIDKLVAKGFRVAVAEQTETPKQAKGLVKREIVRIVTPGTVVNSSLLSENANNYIASLARVGDILGLAVLDVTTADFRVIECETEQELLNEIYRFRPTEFIVSKKIAEKQATLFQTLKQAHPFLLQELDDWHYEHQNAYESLISHFNLLTLEGFGLKGMVAAINAAGALINYIKNMLSLPVGHIQSIQTYTLSQYMALDRISQRNLELTESLGDNSRKNTLLGTLDHTLTPMGARLLRQWIKQPLLSPVAIRLRQQAIASFLQDFSALTSLRKLLAQVRDIERLMMKIGAGYATPRDIVSLRYSLEPLPQLKAALSSFLSTSVLLTEQEGQLQAFPHLVDLIAKALVDEPPLRINEGGLFKEGFHAELDELRLLSCNSKAWLNRYQNQLREETGIKTLKVSYNRLFGYYIEITKGQIERMPSTFERRQTLVNAERYSSPELKEYEHKILTAQERMEGIEMTLFANLRYDVAAYHAEIHQMAQAIAQLDVLQALALAAKNQHYTCPIIDDSPTLQIVEGRHPVIETAFQTEKFVPNDTALDADQCRLMLITGPNMAGKSTYLRQVALIVIMAQIGSFIPAKSAHIGIVDKVFTRIGASDDLARGQSTFMVEMTETALILHHATDRSLVILDEIGRGTSTYDGISIAWAVAEHLLITEGRQAKTLFATHYAELMKLEEKVPGAMNYHVAVHESADQIIFLRKIVKGGTDKSYGVHVGRLAGLPPAVIQRAKEILIHLEENANRKNVFEPSKPKRVAAKSKISPDLLQLTFFGGE